MLALEAKTFSHSNSQNEKTNELVQRISRFNNKNAPV